MPNQASGNDRNNRGAVNANKKHRSSSSGSGSSDSSGSESDTSYSSSSESGKSSPPIHGNKRGRSRDKLLQDNRKGLNKKGNLDNDLKHIFVFSFINYL